VMAGGTLGQLVQAMLLGPWLSRKGAVTLRTLETKPSQADLEDLTALLAAGRVVPVIDRCYPLREVPEAIRHMEDGHVRGKIVISVAKN